LHSAAKANDIRKNCGPTDLSGEKQTLTTGAKHSKGGSSDDSGLSEI